MRSPTRRQVLGAGLAAGASAALGGCTSHPPPRPPVVSRAASVPPAGSDLGAVEHVVFLMQENRSFDHYFGAYPGVRGFDDHSPTDLGAFSQAWPSGTGSSPAGRLLPFHLDTLTQNAECTYDLGHGWPTQHRCWNGGAMDRFVVTHTDAGEEGANGVVTMGYYRRADLAFHYALADAFTLCDAYHCSVFGPTHPNRLHWLSGTLDPDGRAGGPVLITNPSPSAQFSVSWETMPERLESAGVSWKTYNPAGADYQPTSPNAMAVSDNILLYFRQYDRPGSALYEKAFTPVYPDDFAHDVAAGTLPQVSWIIPPDYPVGFDEHPPGPPALGAYFINQVVATLVSNPAVWARTVLFISWDENDGLFDHVPPPVPPAGTPGEYLTVQPLPTEAGGVAGPIGLGVRVPLLVVSPFSRGGYVSSQTFDHTSQLRFLESRFGVEVPNLSAWRRSVTGDLTSTVSTATPDTTAPALPATPRDDPRVQRECQPEQIGEHNVDTGPYPVPRKQTMPKQDPGHPRRLPPATPTPSSSP